MISAPIVQNRRYLNGGKEYYYDNMLGKVVRDPQYGVMDALSQPSPTAKLPGWAQGVFDSASNSRFQNPNQQNLLETTSLADQTMAGLLRDPSKMQATPWYQASMDSGLQALNRGLAAKGHLNSGNRDIELTKYGQGLAAQQYYPMMQMLSGLSGQGNQLLNSSGSQQMSSLLGAGNLALQAQNQQQNRIDDSYQTMMRQATMNDAGGGLGLRQYGQQQFAKGWGY
jgi:hypothetical protein